MMSERETKSVTRRKEVARMIKAGMSRQEIRQRLGLSRERLTQDVHLARRDGFLPEFQKRRTPEETLKVRMQKQIEAAKIGGGTMYEVYGAITSEVQDWLVGQVPNGSSVSDTVAAIITDAYFEENPDA